MCFNIMSKITGFNNVKGTKSENSTERRRDSIITTKMYNSMCCIAHKKISQTPEHDYVHTTIII